MSALLFAVGCVVGAIFVWAALVAAVSAGVAAGVQGALKQEKTRLLGAAFAKAIAEEIAQQIQRDMRVTSMVSDALQAKRPPTWEVTVPLVDMERMLGTFNYPSDIEKAALNTFDFAIDERRGLPFDIRANPIILCLMAYTLIEEAAAEAHMKDGNVDMVVAFLEELLGDLRQNGAAIEGKNK